MIVHVVLLLLLLLLLLLPRLLLVVAFFFWGGWTWEYRIFVLVIEFLSRLSVFGEGFKKKKNFVNKAGPHSVTCD